MKFNRNSNIFIQEIAFENVICNMASILSLPQWVSDFNCLHLLIIENECVLAFLLQRIEYKDGQLQVKYSLIFSSIWLIRLKYFVRSWSTPRLLIPWLLVMPGHQHPWYRICKIVGLVFHKEGCELPVWLQCRRMIEDANIFVCFLKNSANKWW